MPSVFFILLSLVFVGCWQLNELRSISSSKANADSLANAQYTQYMRDLQSDNTQLYKTRYSKPDRDTVPYSIFIDSRDSKKYKAVVIGKQTWMAENLNYDATGSKCYDNSEVNCTTYGRLYDWETATKVCPQGWHLPSKAEWKELLESIDHKSLRLKAVSGWDSNDKRKGWDTYGFMALPGGLCESRGDFKLVGKRGYWWSASEEPGFKFRFQEDVEYKGNIHYIEMFSDEAWIGSWSKSYLISVRCLQD